jgi:hypothetical protein
MQCPPPPAHTTSPLARGLYIVSYVYMRTLVSHTQTHPVTHHFNESLPQAPVMDASASAAMHSACVSRRRDYPNVRRVCRSVVATMSTGCRAVMMFFVVCSMATTTLAQRTPTTRAPTTRAPTRAPTASPFATVPTMMSSRCRPCLCRGLCPLSDKMAPSS